MKSIKEKSEAYDEALKKAKDMLSYKEVRQEDIEYLFPELKESKDEKMRAMAIKAVHAPEAQSCIKSWGINPDDVIAWLEKQGEHAKFRDSIQVGDKVTRNEDGVLVNLSQLNRVAKKQGKNNMGISEATKQKLEDNLHKALEKETPESWNEFLEKQDEYKPNPCDECININGCINCENGELKETEQNPAWSKEDIELLDNTIKFIEDSVAATSPSLRTYNPTLTGKEIPFLKALKDRVQPQPKQEWSEEDEKVLHAIRNALNYEKPRNYLKSRDFEFTDILDWLKSLRPQNHWKPSSLQMGCLSDAIKHYNKLGFPAPILVELFEDLKKL